MIHIYLHKSKLNLCLGLPNCKIFVHDTQLQADAARVLALLSQLEGADDNDANSAKSPPSNQSPFAAAKVDEKQSENNKYNHNGSSASTLIQAASQVRVNQMLKFLLGTMLLSTMQC